MEPLTCQNVKSDSPVKKVQDIGSISKKKKERENRNSVSSCDLVHEWVDKQEYVIINLFVGIGHDNKSVSPVTKDQEISVVLSDRRKFQVQLYEKVVQEETKISFKGPKCIIKLTKFDPSICWPSLEQQRNTLPDKNIQQKQRETLKASASSNSKSTEMEVDGGDQEKLIDLIKVNQVKTNFIERQNEYNLTLYLYISQLKKDSIKAEFTPLLVTVQFSTGDPNFLKNHSNATEDSVFEWSLKPKYEIDPEGCSFKVTPSTMEMKLKKTNNQMWSTISASSENSADKPTKNTWMSVGKNGTDKHSSIPPAPPAPPAFHEAKKPTCLVSPAKASSSSSNTLSSFPLSSLGAEGGITSSVCPKGLSGLDNIGNTCFMNSVLQCLMNTRELREYFKDPEFQQDLNKENPLGMGGKLAIAFAVLMKLMWSGTVRSYPPSKLKGVMSLKANQFSGFAQHDAQEFMVELLDGLHEDLNRVKKKPYIADPPDLDGKPDQEAANESWRLHKLRNDSIIDDLFKGQFKSTLTCHECNKVSVKFDEFCCLSVPIPKDQKTILIIFFWRNTEKQPKKFSIRLPADASIEELKLQLSNRTAVEPSSIQVTTEAEKYKIHKIFARGSNISSVIHSEVLMAFETLTEQQIGEPVVELVITQRLVMPNPPSKCAACTRLPAPNTKLKRCTKCFRVGYCDTNCQKAHWNTHKPHCKTQPEPVGCPFILSLPESEATYSNLARMAESYARFSVDIFQPPVVQMIRRRVGSTSSGEMSSEGEEMEVDSEGGVRESSAYSGEDRAEADWPLGGSLQGPRNSRQRRNSSLSSNSSGGEEIPQLSSSPKLKGAQHPQKTWNTPATRLFTLRPVNNRAQNLAAPNGEPITDKGDEVLDLKEVHCLGMDWCTNERVPVHCFIQNKEIDCEIAEEQFVQRSRHTSLEACVDLFTQPENLSEGDCWRCPRCKKPVEATKQMAIWRLPTILIIQLKRFSFKYVLYSDKIDKFVEYPDKNLDMAPFMSKGSTDSPAIYDLYGVINHMGRLLGGHYTSYCRTVDPEDTTKSEIDWRLCDDSRVNFTNTSRIVHDQAYLLLYRRRGVNFNIERPIASPKISKSEVIEQKEVPMEVSSSGNDPPSTVQEELD